MDGSSMTTTELVFVSIVGVVMVFQILATALQLLPMLLLWLEKCRELLAGAVGKASEAQETDQHCHPLHDAALQLVLESQLREMRVHYMRNFLYYVNIVVGVSLAVISANMIGRSERWMTPAQDLTMLLTHFFDMFCYHGLRLRKGRRTSKCEENFVYAVSVIHLIVGIIFTLGAHRDFAMHTHLLLTPVLISSIACVMNVKLSMVLSLVYVSATYYKLTMDPSQRWTELSGFLVTFELFVLLYSNGAAYLVRTATLGEVHQAIAARTWRTERQAAEGLLDLLCDCVVELNSNLHMVSKSAKLASMLFITEPSRLLERPLDWFMTQASKTTFSDVLRAGNNTVAGAINLELQDTMNNVIAVELFYIQFADSVDGQNCYLVGLREYGDGDIAAVPRGTQATIGPSRSASFASVPEELDSAAAPEGLHSVVQLEGRSDRSPSVRGAACLETISEYSALSESDVCRVDEPVRQLSTIPSLSVSWLTRQEPTFRARTDELAPGARSTQPTVMRAMLVALLETWMPGDPAPIDFEACCLYHASLAHLKGLVAEMSADACTAAFDKGGPWQCITCGVLAADSVTPNDRCSSCELLEHQLDAELRGEFESEASEHRASCEKVKNTFITTEDPEPTPIMSKVKL
eukprot:TRINITY_DN15179_c0_g1_i2.p1 TRINITY_DN15179_c0_g1~~TRINITY_DN15179_c0_g1_i2.p1  ORF type:complete len:636 (-),score=82.61 TRINITY_DN15179_c0_g1_i2:390-2297(-)